MWGLLGNCVYRGRGIVMMRNRHAISVRPKRRLVLGFDERRVVGFVSVVAGFLDSWIRPCRAVVDCLRGVHYRRHRQQCRGFPLSKRNATTKWPLLGIHMTCAAALHRVNRRLNLQWRPRDENSYAGALTNGNFSAFTLENRVPLSLEDLPLDMLFRLAAALPGCWWLPTALSFSATPPTAPRPATLKPHQPKP